MLHRSGSLTDNRGFALLTMLFFLTGMAIMAAGMLPSIAARVQTRVGQKIAMDISVIQGACRRYYIKIDPDKGKEEYYWPDNSFDDLFNLGCLPPWNALTPFKKPYYIYTEDLTDGNMYVGLELPADAGDIAVYLSRMLPNTQYTDGMLWSAVPPPGKAKFIETTDQYIKDEFEDFKIRWIFDNVKVIDEGMATVGWWSNYNPWKPGTLYGSRMQVRVLRLEVSTYDEYYNSLPGDERDPETPKGKEYENKVKFNYNDIGLVIPTEGAIYTRYQPNPDLIAADAVCRDSTAGCGGTFMPTGRWKVNQMPPQ